MANVPTSWRTRYHIDATYRTVLPSGITPPGGALILRPIVRPDSGRSQVVIWNHGAGANASQAIENGNFPGDGLPRLCDAGFTVISLSGGTENVATNLTPTNGTFHWGNTTHFIPHVKSWIEWARRQPELKADRVAVMGLSMGGYASLSIAKHLRSDVACVVTDVGMASAISFRQRILDTWPALSPVAGLPSASWGIAHAWGVVDNTSQPRANPMPPEANLIGHLKGLPLLSFYGMDDPWADEQWMFDLHDDIGPTAALVNAGPGGHTAPGGAIYDADRTISFLREFTK